MSLKPSGYGGEVKVAKANIKYFTERVDEASSFGDLARVPLAFRPMDMYVDENGKVQEIGIRVSTKPSNT